jgi:hypothetical protein
MNQSQKTKTLITENCLDSFESAVVQCLLYFDTFSYPLTIDEVKNFCSARFDRDAELKNTLDLLLHKNLIKQKEIFYFVNSDESCIERRLKGNKMAEQVMPKAIKYGKFIAQFPFVETVCISGSLSKNYFDEKGDVDFFIITKAQRLWLCRSLLVGFKKIFLLNSRKYFCVNYFVGNDNLSIPDRNIFTATEIASLIPIGNFDGFTNFIEHNQWMYDQLPNFNLNKKKTDTCLKVSSIKKLSEKLLSSRLGEFADKQLFKLTLNIWQKKFNHFNKTDFDLNMRSRKNVSKHHPSGFQQKVLNSWALGKENYCKKHQIVFANV